MRWRVGSCVSATHPTRRLNPRHWRPPFFQRAP